ASERVTDYLRRTLPADAQPRRLFEAMAYSLLASGKRVRPLLCLATARTFGVDEDTAMPAAAALEMVHCYSLIHDDLPALDNDDLRRGQPTNHRVFGEATALLAGDALLAYAFEWLAQPLPIPADRQVRMVHVLARAAGPFGMVGGQQADLLASGGQGGLDLLEFIHVRKTAALIQAAVLLGGLFADLTEQQYAALAAYGLHIGHAFQMVDDWLDVAGDSETLGKRTGVDEALHKLTYPSLVGLAETKRRAYAELEAALSALRAAAIEAPLLVGIARFVVERVR
ncbi:MAG: polyprenyl synthetase family protein, partial [Alicyclobacillus sp.]|nr:polyprenyl synthetase family protein [Alicyclobacillus sp.]